MILNYPVVLSHRCSTVSLKTYPFFFSFLTKRGKHSHEELRSFFVSCWQRCIVNFCLKLNVADLKKPLMGTVQERQGVIPLPADRPSQAIVDVSENMRAKIYSMFCKLGEFLLIYGVLRPSILMWLSFLNGYVSLYVQVLTQFLVYQLWITSQWQ